MNKIAFMCDSGADITLEQEKELNIHVVRLPIFIDGKEYEEATELNHVMLAKMLDEGKVAKTSQPSPGKLKKIWDKLLVEYEEILYIPISRPLSGTYSVAKTLSEEYGEKVVVVNSTFATNAIVELIIDARKLVEKGMKAKEIARKIEEEIKMEAFILPYDLHTLKRGGRISPATAALAGFLKIQVLLKLDKDGVIHQVDKTRALSKAHTLLVETAKVSNPQDYHWKVLHSSDIETAKKIQSLLKKSMEYDVDISELLAVVRAHTGNKTIGIYRINKLI